MIIIIIIMLWSRVGTSVVFRRRLNGIVLSLRDIKFYRCTQYYYILFLLLRFAVGRYRYFFFILRPIAYYKRLISDISVENIKISPPRIIVRLIGGSYGHIFVCVCVCVGWSES